MDFIELKKTIDKFNNIDLQIVKQDDKVNKLEQYKLDQFNWNMSKRNYYQEMRDEKKGFKKYKQKQFSNIDLIQTQLDKNTFGKKWSKLDKVSKLKKLDEYIYYLVNKYKLSVANKQSLKKFVYSEFNRKKITNKMVVYNQETFKITEIKYIETFISNINK